MTQDYKCNFVNLETGTTSKAVIQCETDDTAKRVAAQLLAQANHYHRVEIWHGDRHVDTHPPPDIAPQDDPV